jgi:hypothetical protein
MFRCWLLLTYSWWKYPKNQLSVVSLLRDWTILSFRSAKVSLLSNKCTGNYSKQKSVICIYFYRLIDWKMLDTFFNSGNQMFDNCLLPLSFFLQIPFKDWKDSSIGESFVWQEFKRFTGILKHIDCTKAWRNTFYKSSNCLRGIFKQFDCWKTE